MHLLITPMPPAFSSRYIPRAPPRHECSLALLEESSWERGSSSVTAWVWARQPQEGVRQGLAECVFFLPAGSRVWGREEDVSLWDCILETSVWPRQGALCTSFLINITATGFLSNLIPRKEVQSERDHSDKLVQFNIFTQTLVVVILWDASRHSGRFSKAKIGGNIQCSDLVAIPSSWVQCTHRLPAATIPTHMYPTHMLPLIFQVDMKDRFPYPVCNSLGTWGTVTMSMHLCSPHLISH